MGVFALQEGSPCIDVGIADLNNYGLENITDYYGLAPDMGAVEFIDCSSSLGDLNVKIKLDKDNWALIKDASFKPFESPRSCANTIDSNCIRNLTPEQCVQKCKNSEYCDAGYWINIPKKTDKGSEGSYCLPLSTFF